MNLPNKLTISRIAMAGLFLAFLFIRGAGAKFMALGLFTIACLTDYYDGVIARRNNLVTDFGKLMDPIADKILVLGAFLSFVEMKIIPAWMVIIILSRELIITGIRITALTQKKVLQAEIAGKNKTVSQMVSVYAILIFLIIRDSGFTFYYISYYRIAIYTLMAITVVMTLISGISFMLKNKSIFMGEID